MTSKLTRPMLAATFSEERTQKHLLEDGLLLVQPKIDGMRVLHDDGVARSRSWKLWTNSALQAFAANDAELTHGWDGEILPGIIDTTPTEEAFREAMSGIRAADGSKSFTYYLFDNFDPSWATIPYWMRFIGIFRDLAGPVANLNPERDFEDICKMSQTGDICRSFAGNGFTCLVRLCPTYTVTTMRQLYVLEERFLDEGFEGAIIRRKGRGYKWNRATALEGSLTKLKRFVDFEAVIDGVYPRQRNDNQAQTSALGYTVRSAHKANKVDLECIGGFHCHLMEDPTVTFDVGVLKNLDMGTKEKLWQVRESLIGKIITCKEQEYKGGYEKPRTPSFHRFRDPIEL